MSGSVHVSWCRWADSLAHRRIGNKDAGNSGSKSSVQCASNGKDMIHQSVYNHQHTEACTTRCKESSSQPQHSTANMTNFALLANDPTEPCQPDTDTTRTHAGGKSNQATPDKNMNTRASTHCFMSMFWNENRLPEVQLVDAQSDAKKLQLIMRAHVAFSSLRQKTYFFCGTEAEAFTVQFT